MRSQFWRRNCRRWNPTWQPLLSTVKRLGSCLWFIITTKLLGVYWFHSVCSSVCPASRVRSVAPTVLVRSISYLHILSSNFRRCVACKVSCKILKFDFWQFFKICNFDFVFFWLGIWCESLVWVNMGRRGVSQNVGILVVLVFIKNVVAVAAYSRLASRSQAKFHTKKLSPLVRPCAAAPAQSTTSAHRSLRFSPR